jgi:V8-like Glu-specific endopeptidase
MIATRALPIVTLGFLACLAACSSTSGEVGARAGEIGTTHSAVIKGKPSDASQDAVVLLVHYDPNAQGSGVGTCTGTLLAPRLVLTARHCVGDTDAYAACKVDGTPLAAGVVRKNHKPETMYVFTGKDRPDFSRGEHIEPAGTGLKILDDGGKNLCNHDIALIVLKEPITGVPIAPVRLDSEVTVGELITAVGWGVTEKTSQPEQRQQRKDVQITKVGPDKAISAVPPNEFEVGEAICSGDSGGPAIAQETNAVVGVVSRGGNAQGSDSSDPAANCIDGKNLYTKVAPFKELILQGYELAGAEPWVEGGPDPRKAKSKEACASADECRSALCLPDPDASNETTCAEDCSVTESCSVEGEICTTEDDAKVCRLPKIVPPPPAAPKTSGLCSSVPHPRGSGALGASIVLGMLALAGLRRRRS